MSMFFQRGKFRVIGALTAACALTLASCGTILHPERRGQPAGRLDAGVVLLDGIGLLLFLVPGVIAFAVDFGTGAIYLPPGQSALPTPETDFRSVRVDPADLTPERLEEVVKEQTGKTVRLQEGDYRARRVDNVRALSTGTFQEMQDDPTPTQVRFRASRD